MVAREFRREEGCRAPEHGRASPPVVDLATPSKDRRRGAGGPADVSGLDSNSDIEDSPQLPGDWLPLEYELLEFVDALPADLARRVSSELEAQERRVAHLRAENAELRAAASQAAARAAPQPAPCRPESAATPGANLSILAESARQLEAKARQVRQAAEHELLELARRARAAEAQQHHLSRQAAQDAARRRRLWEADAELQRLLRREVQLNGLLEEAEGRACQHEKEEKDLAADIEHLQAEVRRSRAEAPDLQRLEQREHELRHQLRAAKTALRSSRCGHSHRSSSVPAAALVPPQTRRREAPDGSRTRSRCSSQSCLASPLLAMPTPVRAGGGCEATVDGAR